MLREYEERRKRYVNFVQYKQTALHLLKLAGQCCLRLDVLDGEFCEVNVRPNAQVSVWVGICFTADLNVGEGGGFITINLITAGNQQGQISKAALNVKAAGLTDFLYFC